LSLEDSGLNGKSGKIREKEGNWKEGNGKESKEHNPIRINNENRVSRKVKYLK
jgi:hypothetical protein